MVFVIAFGLPSWSCDKVNLCLFGATVLRGFPEFFDFIGEARHDKAVVMSRSSLVRMGKVGVSEVV